jgi:uncharacterized protein (TIGR03435 family)
MRLFWAGLLVAGTATVAMAQRPEFEVATVRVPAHLPFGALLSINLGTFRNGSLTLTNVSLAECLQFAYGVVSQDQITGPDWIKARDTRFDIVAKAAPETDLEQARQMLQTLLADRLKLVVHHDPRPFSFLALVPAKGGPKLVAAPETPNPSGNTSFPGRIAGDRMPMQVLASLLSRFEQQLVVDQTGLTGRYQVKLEWMSDGLATALQEQLGLRLESRKGPLDVIVVDSVERVPTDN